MSVSPHPRQGCHLGFVRFAGVRAFALSVDQAQCTFGLRFGKLIDALAQQLFSRHVPRLYRRLGTSSGDSLDAATPERRVGPLDILRPGRFGRWVSLLFRSRYRSRVFDETLIAEAGRRLLRAAPARTRVILFGSHARGDAGPHSDLDFLVVEPSVEDATEESVRLRRTLRGLGLFADVIVVSEREAEKWGDAHGSVIHAALSEGRPLAA